MKEKNKLTTFKQFLAESSAPSSVKFLMRQGAEFTAIYVTVNSTSYDRSDEDDEDYEDYKICEGVVFAITDFDSNISPDNFYSC